MSEITNFFIKIVDVYGESAGLVFLVIVGIGLFLFFLTKNFSTIIKNLIEKR